MSVLEALTRNETKQVYGNNDKDRRGGNTWFAVRFGLGHTAKRLSAVIPRAWLTAKKGCAVRRRAGTRHNCSRDFF